MRTLTFVVLASVTSMGCGRSGFVFPNGDTLGQGDNDGSPGDDSSGGATTLRLTAIQGAAWNQYVASGPTACTGDDYRNCTHAGEVRRFTVGGAADCTDLTLSDSADAFYWACTTGLSGPEFVSTGLKPGRGLRDLIDFDAIAFRAMTVTLQRGGESVTSAPAVWWPNPVEALPGESLPGYTVPDQAETVYVAVNGYSGNIQGLAAGVSIVVPRGQFLSPTDDNTVQCNAYRSATGTAASARCAITSNNSERIWVEADFAAYNGTTAFNGISTESGKLIRINACTFGAGYVNPIFFDQTSGSRVTSVTAGKGDSVTLYGSNNNLVRDTRLAGSALSLVAASNNVIADVTAFGSATGVSATSGSASNHFAGLLSFATTQAAWAVDKTSASNTLVASTIALSSEACINIGAGATATLILGSIAFGSATAGLQINGTETIITDLLAGESAQAGIVLATGAGPSRFSGALRVTASATPCSIMTSDVAPGLTSACGPQGNSDPSLVHSVTGSVASSFAGNVGDASNSSVHVDGSADFIAATFDYADADNRFRGWAPAGSFVGTGQRGCPAPGPGCFAKAGAGVQFVDFTPLASDTQVRNGIIARAFINGAACPIDGNFAMQTPNGNTYLRAARELLDDAAGDDDGLCESNELCVYAPSFGAYQGDGDYRTHRCVFTDGKVTGVTLYGYPPVPPPTF